MPKDGSYKPTKASFGSLVPCGRMSRGRIPRQCPLKSSSSGGKKKLSGFMLFSKEHRPKIKEENPDITFGQIGKKLGEMWRALDDKEKQAYKDRKERRCWLVNKSFRSHPLKQVTLKCLLLMVLLIELLWCGNVFNLHPPRILRSRDSFAKQKDSSPHDAQFRCIYIHRQLHRALIDRNK
eukprot:scaffold175_cov177-Amphora_coffeaeformis.AAC.11